MGPIHVRISGGGQGAVSRPVGRCWWRLPAGPAWTPRCRAGGALPYRKPRATHDPGKILLDLTLAIALGGDCLADVDLLRAQPSVFGPVASDLTVSRPAGTLVAASPHALAAVRRARSDARQRVWRLACQAAPDAGGDVIVDVDGALVLAH